MRMPMPRIARNMHRMLTGEEQSTRNITGASNAPFISDEDLQGQVIIFGILCAAGVAFFSCLRGSRRGSHRMPEPCDPRPVARGLHLPRALFRCHFPGTMSSTAPTPVSMMSVRTRCSKAIGNALGLIGCRWMHALLQFDERKVARAVGADAAVLLSFLRMCCLLFGAATPVVLCVLLPVYGQGEGTVQAATAAPTGTGISMHGRVPDEEHSTQMHSVPAPQASKGLARSQQPAANDAPATDAQTSVLQRYSLSNVAVAPSAAGGGGQWRLWPAVAMAYAFTWWALRLLNVEWRRFTALRRLHGRRSLGVPLGVVPGALAAQGAQGQRAAQDEQEYEDSRTGPNVSAPGDRASFDPEHTPLKLQKMDSVYFDALEYEEVGSGASHEDGSTVESDEDADADELCEHLAVSGAELITVMVEHLPLRLRSDDALRAHFERLFGHGLSRSGPSATSSTQGMGRMAVVAAHVALRNPVLESLCEQRNESLWAAERALAAFDSSASAATAGCWSWCCCRESGAPAHTIVIQWTRCICYRVRTVEWRLCELARLNKAVADEQKRMVDAQRRQRQERSERLRRAARDHGHGLKALAREASSSDGLGRSNTGAAGLAKDAAGKVIGAAGKVAGAVDDAAHKVLGSFVGQELGDTGFVTFCRRTEATLAAQVAYSGGRALDDEFDHVFDDDDNAQPIEVSSAPEPRDIDWSNLGVPRRRRAMRWLLMNFAAVLLAVFWSVPSAFVATLADAQRIAAFLNLRRLQDEPGLAAALAMLSPLALSLLMAALVPLLRMLCQMENHFRHSDLQLSLMRKYFTFLVLQVFLLQIIAGTLVSSLKLILDRPSDVVIILGQQVPQTSVFFMQYIWIKACTFVTLELLRVVELAMASARSCLLRCIWGIRSNHRVDSAGQQTGALYTRPLFGTLFPLPSAEDRPAYTFDHGRVLAEHLLVLLLGFSYATVSPLLLLFVVFHFFVSYVLWRYQLLFVYQPTRNRTSLLGESGGMLWPTLFRCAVAALLIGQTALEGIMSLKGGYTQAATLLALPFATVYAAWQMESTHMPPAARTPIEDAFAASASDGAHPLLPSPAVPSPGHDESVDAATLAAVGRSADPEVLAEHYVAPHLRKGDVRLGRRWRRVLRAYTRAHPPTTPLQGDVAVTAMSPAVRLRARTGVGSTEYGSMSLNTGFMRAAVL